MTRTGLVVLIVFVAALASFTYVANGPKGTLALATTDWSKVVDDPAAKLKISWLGDPDYPNAIEGGWIERMLEERFNIELKPEFMHWADYVVKKPMMLSGGKIPDVMWEAGTGNVQKDARNGFIIELPYELILKHAPHYVKAVNEIAPEAWLYSYYKEPGMARGMNMGVPTTWAGGWYPPPGVWRLDWLKKVGIRRTPETLEEMEEAFDLFRRANVGDQGAEVGTYGMSGNMYTWWTNFSDVFCAFGVLPHDWVLRGEKVVWGGVQPEAREALALLRKWYRLKLIHPDFVSDRRPEVLRKFLNGKIGYVNWRGDWASLNLSIPNSLHQQIRQINPRAELAVGRFPIGPRGDRGFHVWGGGGNVMAFGRGCLKRPEKVIRVLKMLNTLAQSEQLLVYCNMGKRGLHWEYRLPLTDPATGQPVTDPKTGKVVMDTTSGTTRIGPYADRVYANIHLTVGTFTVCDTATPRFDKYLSADRVKFRTKYRHPKWGRKDFLMGSGVVPSAGKLLRALRELQNAYYADIIRGTRPLGDFEEFVRKWNAQGGATLRREANELHHEMKWIFQQVGAKPRRRAG